MKQAGACGACGGGVHGAGSVGARGGRAGTGTDFDEICTQSIDFVMDDIMDLCRRQQMLRIPDVFALPMLCCCFRQGFIAPFGTAAACLKGFKRSRRPRRFTVRCCKPPMPGRHWWVAAVAVLEGRRLTKRCPVCMAEPALPVVLIRGARYGLHGVRVGEASHPGPVVRSQSCRPSSQADAAVDVSDESDARRVRQRLNSPDGAAVALLDGSAAEILDEPIQVLSSRGTSERSRVERSGSGSNSRYR